MKSSRPRTGLRFGVRAPVPGTGSPDEVRAFLDWCTVAETLGFDFLTVAHHRFTEPPSPGTASAPLMWLSAAAVRTSEIGLSSAILLLPTHHPLDVAEQAATLDRISGGRVTLGVGIGYRIAEYAPVGIEFSSRGTRLAEAIEVIRAAWSDEMVQFEGRHFQISAVSVHPKPKQRPGPPIWVGGNTQQSVQRAGQVADGYITSSLETIDELQGLVNTYRTASAAAGHEAHVSLMRLAHCGRSRRSVEETWLPRALNFFSAYHDAQPRGRAIWQDSAGLGRRLARGDDVSYPQFVPGRAVAGTPDDCIREIVRYRDDLGVDSVSFIFDVEDRFATDHIEYFAREVLDRVPGTDRDGAP